MIVNPYPKDDEPRVLTPSQELLDSLVARSQALGLSRDDLFFPSTEASGGNPLSRNTFRTRIWGLDRQLTRPSPAKCHGCSSTL